MSLYKSPEENIPTYSEAYYEELASQEELYLEETEEEVRLILISYGSCSLQDGRSTIPESCGMREPDWVVEEAMTDLKNNSRMGESPDEQLAGAAEELITGDSDDPPLSEKTVVEMLNDSHAQRLKSAS